MYIYMPTFCTTQKPVSQVFPNTCPLLPPVFLKELQSKETAGVNRFACEKERELAEIIHH
jgi:hypothetical protein